MHYGEKIKLGANDTSDVKESGNILISISFSFKQIF